jgi:hypothetical protein
MEEVVAKLKVFSSHLTGGTDEATKTSAGLPENQDLVNIKVAVHLNNAKLVTLRFKYDVIE